MERSILLLGEAWGEYEREEGRAFVGPSGRLLRAMLRQSGIPESACHFTNVFNQQPPNNNILAFTGAKSEALPLRPPLQPGKFVRAEFASELNRLEREITAVQPNLILCLGGTALWAIHGTSSISKVRGTLATTSSRRRRDGLPFKTLATFHPSAVLRQWSNRPAVLMDLAKAARHMYDPRFIRPSRKLWLEPALADLDRFWDEYLFRPTSVSTDIETASGQITEIGFAPNPSIAIVVPFYSRSAPDGNYWKTKEDELQAWLWVKKVCEAPHLDHGGQNFLYDIHYLYRTAGIRCPGRWDTMLLHHALQPESEKGLGFLGSLYTDEPAWKFMRKEETLKKED